MNRRKFIFSVFMIGGGAAATYYGYEFIKNNEELDVTLLQKNKLLIGDLVELIIPKTDTPGAKEAMVHEYVIDRIVNSSSNKIQRTFLDGIVDVTKYCEDEYSTTFSNLKKEDQVNVLTHFQQKGRNFNGLLGKIKNKVFGKSFFAILKEYTCVGYCTSMLGVTKGLAYNAIPTSYIACTNYTSGQKSWATK